MTSCWHKQVTQMFINHYNQCIWNVNDWVEPTSQNSVSAMLQVFLRWKFGIPDISLTNL